MSISSFTSLSLYIFVEKKSVTRLWCVWLYEIVERSHRTL